MSVRRDGPIRRRLRQEPVQTRTGRTDRGASARHRSGYPARGRACGRARDAETAELPTFIRQPADRGDIGVLLVEHDMDLAMAAPATGEPRHFATLWEAIADALPAAPALTHGARTIGWGDFEQRAARLAGALQAHGLRPGSTVACYLYNCPEYFETFLAALKIRAVPANVNYRYSGAELRALLENCEAEALFFHSALRERVTSVRHEIPWVRLLVEIEGS